MKNGVSGLALAGLALGCSSAFAGGLERNLPRISPLFEEGRYLEFSATYVAPSLSGDEGVIPPGFAGPTAVPVSGSTGDLLSSYFTLGAAYKSDLPGKFSYALILDQPFGASTDYPDGTSLDPTNAANVYGGSVASLDNYRLSTILAYDVTDGVKVYGGPVFSVIEANAAISFLSYDVDSDLDYGIGYLVGAAYEKPDIALRVALTYRSEIRHEFDTVETIGATSVNSQTTIDLPQSLTLDFQTGIAPKTLLFGQVQWMDWSSFEISPPNYPLLASLGRPLVSYEEDWFTYTLGVGRQINDNWSGAFSVTWEPQTNTELTSLGPVDGRWQLGLGATYETEKVKISGGASYAFLGDAENVLATDYSGGDALGFGLRVGFKL